MGMCIELSVNPGSPASDHRQCRGRKDYQVSTRVRMTVGNASPDWNDLNIADENGEQKYQTSNNSLSCRPRSQRMTGTTKFLLAKLAVSIRLAPPNRPLNTFQSRPHEAHRSCEETLRAAPPYPNQQRTARPAPRPIGDRSAEHLFSEDSRCGSRRH
jgi:hypothetical protein